MALNDENFEVIRYGKNEDIKNETVYLINNQHIKVKEHVKNLDILMSSNGTFYHHITKIAESARRLSEWILRTFTIREEHCLNTLWKALVMPRLKYCCQLWSPHTIKEIVTLDAPQRSFTAKIHGVQHLNYWERLKQLNMYSMQRRRERYIILYV